MNQSRMFFSLILAIFTLISCNQKDNLVKELPKITPIVITTEACYAPTGITLILAHPEDNFFYESRAKYVVDWYKDDEFLRTGTRVNCATNGAYKAIVTFLLLDETKEATYTVRIGDDF